MLKEQHGHKEETAHLEELISIARREHDRAVLQAQQVLLQAERERERLTQCAELEKARLREELDIATKKLHSIVAERNLLMVRGVVFYVMYLNKEHYLSHDPICMLHVHIHM